MKLLIIAMLISVSGIGGTSANSPLDLFEQEDVVDWFLNEYADGGFSSSYRHMQAAINNKRETHKHIIKLTYNPNKPENEQYSVEVVHKY